MIRMKKYVCAGVLGFAGLALFGGASNGIAQSAANSVGSGPNDAQIEARCYEGRWIARDSKM